MNLALLRLSEHSATGSQLAKLGKALSGFLREGDCDRIDASIHARRS
jgi:hypothetical protein